MQKVDYLNINWQAFNKRLDKLDRCECNAGPLLEHVHDKHNIDALDLSDSLKDLLNKLNSEKKIYTSDSFVDDLPAGFLERNQIDPKATLIKILGLPSGTFTFPHTDAYTNAKRQFGLPKDAKVKRLWIPCMDYKFGHVLCLDKEVVIDYCAGDVFEIPGNIMHSATNIGIENRRIMTITGAVVDKAA